MRRHYTGRHSKSSTMQPCGQYCPACNAPCGCIHYINATNHHHRDLNQHIWRTENMSRPPKPAMTGLEHDLIHVPGMGLRTAAKIISRSRGAEAASATATEKAWRTVSFAWVKRQHDALGCNKTLGATKPQADPLSGALQQNERPMDYTGTRIAPVQQQGEISERPSDTGNPPSTLEVESERAGVAR